MQRENPLDAFAVGNAAHGERFVYPASFPANNDSGENLNAFLVAFDDAGVNMDAIADGEFGLIGAMLLFFDGVDNAVHKLLLLGRGGPPSSRLRRGRGEH